MPKPQFGSVVFDGQNGQIQVTKPKVEYYTRFGDNRIYVQKINDSAQESSISFWKEASSYSAAKAHVDALKVLIGERKTFKDTHGETWPSAYLIDFTYEIVKKSGDIWLITYSTTMVVDEKATGVQTGLEGDGGDIEGA